MRCWGLGEDKRPGKKANPEGLPPGLWSQGPASAVMHEAWQGAGQPAGAGKVCASIPSGGSQGLQDGDLLAEL